MWDSFFVENDSFRPFTLQHLIVLGLGVLFFVLLIWYARKSSEEKQIQIGAFLAYSILVT